tara:strand:+ start:316 stop:720 length:405 start_codon:yes stop_codon:yes gene_type:complete
MPQTKEEKKEYDILYNLKNKEKVKEKNRLYRLNNKELISKNMIEYRQTEQGKKSHRISLWKCQGILCFDWNLLYDLFISTTYCEFCNCELNTNTKTRKCLDHDHSITDKFNVRGVLCNSCNIKDVLKQTTTNSL